jgi:hypothetical protein
MKGEQATSSSQNFLFKSTKSRIKLSLQLYEGTEANTQISLHNQYVSEYIKNLQLIEFYIQYNFGLLNIQRKWRRSAVTVLNYY